MGEMEPPIADVMVENSPPIGDVLGEPGKQQDGGEGEGGRGEEEGGGLRPEAICWRCPPGPAQPLLQEQQRLQLGRSIFASLPSSSPAGGVRCDSFKSTNKVL